METRPSISETNKPSKTLNFRWIYLTGAVLTVLGLLGLVILEDLLALEVFNLISGAALLLGATMVFVGLAGLITENVVAARTDHKDEPRGEESSP